MDIGKLRRIASAQRFLLLIMLAHIGFLAAIIALGDRFSDHRPGGPDRILAFVLVLYLGVIAVLTLRAVIRLGFALGHNTVLVVLFSPFYCVPFVGLLPLGVLNSRANKAFRDKGITVRFLGVSQATLDVFESATPDESSDRLFQA
jgi:hypothetical protein